MKNRVYIVALLTCLLSAHANDLGSFLKVGERIREISAKPTTALVLDQRYDSAYSLGEKIVLARPNANGTCSELTVFSSTQPATLAKMTLQYPVQPLGLDGDILYVLTYGHLSRVNETVDGLDEVVVFPRDGKENLSPVDGVVSGGIAYLLEQKLKVSKITKKQPGQIDFNPEAKAVAWPTGEYVLTCIDLAEPANTRHVPIEGPFHAIGIVGSAVVLYEHGRSVYYRRIVTYTIPELRKGIEVDTSRGEFVLPIHARAAYLIDLVAVKSSNADPRQAELHGVDRQGNHTQTPLTLQQSLDDGIHFLRPTSELLAYDDRAHSQITFIRLGASHEQTSKRVFPSPGLWRTPLPVQLGDTLYVPRAEGVYGYSLTAETKLTHFLAYTQADDPLDIQGGSRAMAFTIGRSTAYAVVYFPKRREFQLLAWSVSSQSIAP